mmetsp:Transcript_122014/g.340166  ORF Transcript_122014/g.340166 Transcript_122014/m.340166 type:complete len:454 (+) Transcript_122014:52-1413(+)
MEAGSCMEMARSPVRDCPGSPTGVYAPIAALSPPGMAAQPWAGGCRGSPRRLPRSTRTLAAAAATAALLAAALLLLERRGSAEGRGAVTRHAGETAAVPQQLVERSGECGSMERDTAFPLHDGPSTRLDNMLGPGACCASCKAPQCGSWTWVPAQDTAAPGQCFLKEGKPARRLPQAGAFSGLAAWVPAPALADAVLLDSLPPPGSSSSMFCFSLMMPNDLERELVRWQYQQKVSIFACDEAAVLSNKTLDFGSSSFSVTLVDQEFGCRPGDGADWSFNAWLFIAIWRAVIQHGAWQNHDWTVKVDPDAVFFPERLRFILQRQQGSPFLTNCRVGVHGPVQVLSRVAVATLAEDYATSWDGMSPKRCMTEVHLLEYGNCTRDTFLDVCLMQVLMSTRKESMRRVIDGHLSCQSACDCEEWVRCNSDKASFHPHKTVDDYRSCLRNSMGIAGRL